jgi:nicotinamide-nucleotide amidase
MDAEIIAVGSEMLTQERVDTNSLYLTGELNNLGVEVVFKCVIGDDRDRLADAIRRALSRTGIVILSGGLGPTEDDVTRDAVSQAIDRKLIFHPDIADALEQRFLLMKRKMAEVNKRQAFIIEGAAMLPNDRGTAPGQWIEESGGVIVLLPGPPHELKAMFERQVLPRLVRIVPKTAIRTIFYRVTGMSESDLDQLIAPVYKKYENPVTTILAANGDLQIHLRARCVTEVQADALLAEVAGPMELLLGDRLYSRNGAPLEVVVGELLRKHHATVAVAESATGGMLGERFTSVPGSSEYFLGGFITYTNKMKIDLLGVLPETLEKFGAVSHETAEAMALGARRRTNATYALSVTGVAGPDAGTKSAPLGTMYVAIADAAGTHVAHRQFIGDRQRIRVFTSQMALDLLRRRITGRIHVETPKPLVG